MGTWLCFALGIGDGLGWERAAESCAAEVGCGFCAAEAGQGQGLLMSEPSRSEKQRMLTHDIPNLILECHGILRGPG